MEEKKNIQINCGCFGSLGALIAAIAFCAIFSLFLGSGEFYNECIQKVDALIHCNTIPTK